MTDNIPFGLYPHQEKAMQELASRSPQSLLLELDKHRGVSEFKAMCDRDPIFSEALELLESSFSSGIEFGSPVERDAIPRRSGFDGELSFAEVWARPELDLAECIKKAFPISTYQILMEGNGVLAEFHEERNEYDSMSGHLTGGNIDQLINELEALDFKTLHSQVDGISEGDFQDIEFRKKGDRTAYSHAVSQRTKQRGKRK